MTLRLPKPWAVFGLVGPLVLFVWLVFGFATVRFDATMIVNGKYQDEYHLIGRDFVNIWQGGRMAAAGDVERVYDRAAYQADIGKSQGLIGVYNYSYPPHMLMASVPFGLPPYFVALALWTALTFGLFWFAAVPWLKDVGLPAWSSLVLPGTLVNLWAGHFGFLVGALVLLGWRWAETSPVRSGLAFGAMTMKPHLGVLVPLVLLAKAKWQTIVGAGMVTIALIAASLVLFGVAAWTTWLTSTLDYQRSLIGMLHPGAGFRFMMPTVARMAAAMGLTGAANSWFQIGFGMLASLPLIYAWRRGVGLRDLGLMSILATLLILPYVFNYDLVAFDLVILVAAARYQAVLSGIEKIVLGGAYLIPVLQMPLAVAGMQAGPVLILMALIIIARRAVLARETA